MSDSAAIMPLIAVKPPAATHPNRSRGQEHGHPSTVTLGNQAMSELAAFAPLASGKAPDRLVYNVRGSSRGEEQGHTSTVTLGIHGDERASG